MSLLFVGFWLCSLPLRPSSPLVEQSESRSKVAFRREGRCGGYYLEVLTDRKRCFEYSEADIIVAVDNSC